MHLVMQRVDQPRPMRVPNNTGDAVYEVNLLGAPID